VGTLILGAVLSLIVQDVWAIVVAVLGISISIVAATSACLALRERNARLFFVLPVVFVIIHSSYTYGFLSQLLQTVKVRSSKERESAKADATQ
jgi:type II secretory pathway component PulF